MNYNVYKTKNQPTNKLACSVVTAESTAMSLSPLSRVECTGLLRSLRCAELPGLTSQTLRTQLLAWIFQLFVWISQCQQTFKKLKNFTEFCTNKQKNKITCYQRKRHHYRPIEAMT